MQAYKSNVPVTQRKLSCCEWVIRDCSAGGEVWIQYWHEEQRNQIRELLGLVRRLVQNLMWQGSGHRFAFPTGGYILGQTP